MSGVFNFIKQGGVRVLEPTLAQKSTPTPLLEINKNIKNNNKNSAPGRSWGA
jgi:hypothetical protein